MAWFGKITALDLSSDKASWLITVNYYNDNSPDKIIQRVVNVPARASKPDVIASVKDVGSDVMGTFLLNSQNVVGTVIPIP